MASDFWRLSKVLTHIVALSFNRKFLPKSDKNKESYLFLKMSQNLSEYTVVTYSDNLP